MKIGARENLEGTQSIERAVSLMRILATRARFGWTLSELAAAAGLKKATAHRILARLEHERLVYKRGSGDRYFLGAMLGELSLCIPGFHDYATQARELVLELARKLSLVTVLSLRSGEYFVVGARVASRQIRSKVNEEGSYRPLFSTAGGIAILLTLPEAEQGDIIDANIRDMTLGGRTRISDCHAIWERSRKLGIGANFGDIAPGTNSIAVGFGDTGHGAIGSLTVAGLDTHLDEAGCLALVPLLQGEGTRLAEMAAQVHPGLYTEPQKKSEL